MKENLSKSITTWIKAAIILVVGILCIVAENGKDEAGNASEAISLVIGITFIVVASLGLLLKILVLKRAATEETIVDGFLLASGIYFVCQKALAVTLLSILVNYVPYVLVVVGSLFLVDAIVILVLALVKKGDMKAAIVTFAVEFVIATVAIVLGVLALPGVDIISAKLTILGIILICFAVVYALGGVFTLLSSKKPEEVKDEPIVTVEE